MKKRISQIILVMVLLASLLPSTASACGGFVAIKGEKTFHSVYCENMEFENLDNLRWFDTAKKAASSGLKICEECSDYSDWDFDSEFCEYYWYTDDPLIMTAMEMSLDMGRIAGEENAAEEFDWYYESGYEAGFSDGLEQGDYNSTYGNQSSTAKEVSTEKEPASWFSLGGVAIIGIGAYFVYSIIELILDAIPRKKS